MSREGNGVQWGAPQRKVPTAGRSLGIGQERSGWSELRDGGRAGVGHPGFFWRQIQPPNPEGRRINLTLIRRPSSPPNSTQMPSYPTLLTHNSPAPGHPHREKPSPLAQLHSPQPLPLIIVTAITPPRGMRSGVVTGLGLGGPGAGLGHGGCWELDGWEQGKGWGKEGSLCGPARPGFLCTSCPTPSAP